MHTHIEGHSNERHTTDCHKLTGLKRGFPETLSSGILPPTLRIWRQLYLFIYLYGDAPRPPTRDKSELVESLLVTDLTRPASAPLSRVLTNTQTLLHPRQERREKLSSLTISIHRTFTDELLMTMIGLRSISIPEFIHRSWKGNCFHGAHSVDEDETRTVDGVV